MGILLAKDLLRYYLPTRTPLTCATACARRCSSRIQRPDRWQKEFRSTRKPRPSWVDEYGGGPGW